MTALLLFAMLSGHPARNSPVIEIHIHIHAPAPRERIHKRYELIPMSGGTLYNMENEIRDYGQRIREGGPAT